MIVRIGFAVVILDPLLFITLLYGFEDISSAFLWGGAAFIFIFAFLAMIYLQWIFNRYTKPVAIYEEGIEINRNLFSIIARREGFIPRDELASASANYGPNGGESGSLSIKTKNGRAYYIGQRSRLDIQRTVKQMRERWRVSLEEKTEPAAVSSAEAPSREKGRNDALPSGLQNSVKFAFCPNCGVRMGSDYMFCPGCGRRMG